MPNADPYLLPMAGLLAAIGVTEIYRLGPDDAFKQGLWIVIALVLFAVTLVVLRHDYRVLESYKYLFGIGAILLLLLPAVPGIGTTVNGARLWVHVGAFRFQPGELAKIFLIVFLAGYLREKREMLAQFRLKDVGPLLVIWGAAMLVLVETNDLGSALLFFGIFLAMLYVATDRLLYVGRRRRALRRGRGGRLPGRRPRAGAGHDLAPPLDGQSRLLPAHRREGDCARTARAISSSSRSTRSRTGSFGGTGLGKGTFVNAEGHSIIPYVNTDFIYSALAQELGLVGAAADCCSSTCSSSRGASGSR